MLPLIRQGKDLLLIARKTTRTAEQIRCAALPPRQRTICANRILKVRKMITSSAETTAGGVEIGITDRHIIGVLTRSNPGWAKLPVTDQRYRLYVHLWCDLFYLRAAVLWCRDLPGRIKKGSCANESKKIPYNGSAS